VCPSNELQENPVYDVFYEFASQTINSPLGSLLGRTDYVLSKGASDAFCETPRKMPSTELGMYDYALKLKAAQVADGLSNTFAAGEGASGSRWVLCRHPQCQSVDMPQPSFTGEIPVARQYWVGSGNVRKIFNLFKYASAGHLACTVDPLNKSPVIHFLYDDSDTVRNCLGTLSNPANTHRVPNFRSNHPGGASFLLGDGAVQFIEENIDMAVYRAFSTIAGGEVD
jgi:hypothetical protein